jgi:hypothetical protein
MGQLEKYGLYVLCLVIFLILGVAIWGEPDPALAGRANAAALPAAPPAALPDPDVDLNALMSPVPRPEAGAPRDGADDGSLPVGPGADGTRPTGPAAGEREAGPAPRDADSQVAPLAGRAKHTIRHGDRLEDLAAQLGDRRYVALLRELNPGRQPERRRPGREIAMPRAA